MRKIVVAFAALLAAAGAATADAPSPYAGQERRALKALSPGEIDDLLAGRGMGLAKAAELARLQGALRFAHLRAHLAQTALLTPAQIDRYQTLRGYTGAERPAHGGHKH